MKLNFWQWIGLIVVVIALIFIIRDKMAAKPAPAPAVPATAPAM